MGKFWLRLVSECEEITIIIMSDEMERVGIKGRIIK